MRLAITIVTLYFLISSANGIDVNLKLEHSLDGMTFTTAGSLQGSILETVRVPFIVHHPCVWDCSKRTCPQKAYSISNSWRDGSVAHLQSCKSANLPPTYQAQLSFEKFACILKDFSRGEQLTLLRNDLTAQEQDLLANLVQQNL